jgi:hypothetical protein
MAVTKYPWLAPGTTAKEARATADWTAYKRHRRDCVVTAWVEDAHVGELRKRPHQSRRDGAPFIDDISLANHVQVYRVVVAQRLKPGHEHQRWQPPARV